MTLHQYLLAIKDNKAINLKRFLSLLPAKYQHNWRNIFKTCLKTSQQAKHRLMIIDQQSFNAMLAEAKPSQNRIEAALLGNSHQHNTSMSYLLVFPAVTLNAKSKKTLMCPKIMVSDGSVLTQEFTSQKTLVIIENQENFFRYQEFLPKLTDIGGAIDIAFGQGNSISNSLNSIYFNQYKQILCCFDYDLGGLTMFASLKKLTLAQVTFLAPPATSLNNQAFINKHFKKTPDTAVHWQKAIALAIKLDLNDLAHAFNISKKFMEQEVFLSNLSSGLQEEKR